jgi:hypothetical protein
LWLFIDAAIQFCFCLIIQTLSWICQCYANIYQCPHIIGFNQAAISCIFVAASVPFREKILNFIGIDFWGKFVKLSGFYGQYIIHHRHSTIILNSIWCGNFFPHRKFHKSINQFRFFMSREYENVVHVMRKIIHGTEANLVVIYVLFIVIYQWISSKKSSQKYFKSINLLSCLSHGS